MVWHDRWLLSYIVVVVVVSLGLFGCEHLRRGKNPPEPTPRTQLLSGAGEAVPVVMSQLGAPARRMVSSAAKIPVEIHFDPSMIDMPRVEKYSLWTRSGSAAWTRLIEVEPSELPIEVALEEGTFGLRGSARYKRGEEVLVPRVNDEPAVWLVVDRSPPEVTWVAPAPNSPVNTTNPLHLTWAVNEAVEGSAPYELEWSANGESWQPIAKIEPRTGHVSHTWVPPSSLGSNFQVRVKVRDLAGHEYAPVLPLQRGLSSMLEVVDGDDISGTTPAVGADGTPEATSGTDEVPLAMVEPGALRIRTLKSPVLKGGSTVEIQWRIRGLDPEKDVVFEWRRPNGTAWQEVAQTKLGASKLTWTIPCENLAGCWLRARVLNSDGPDSQAQLPQPLTFDCVPPEIRLVGLPQVLPATATVQLAVEDGASLGAVRVFLRDAPENEWKPLDAGQVALHSPEVGTASGKPDGGLQVSLDLREVAEAEFEIVVIADDTFGNAAPAPSSTTEPQGRFRLDRTPPGLQMEVGPHPWVQGFRAQLHLQADWSDIAQPVSLEGRRIADGVPGAWVELERWNRVSPGQDQFAWTLPIGFERCQVRVAVRDPAGNETQRISEARPVIPAIQLVGMEQPSAKALETKILSWTLHPIAESIVDELQVQIDHQSAPTAAWVSVCSQVGVDAQCAWDVGDGGGDQNRLRIQILRGGEVLSQQVSAPFSIRSSGSEETQPLLSEDSLALLQVARQQARHYRENLRLSPPGEKPSAELQQLSTDVTLSFRKAIEADANNFQATYGLAQFLNRLPGSDSSEVEKYLQQTLTIKSDHYWAYNDLGALHISEGDYAEAEEALQSAEKLRPSAVVSYNLGLALYYQGKMASARAKFNAALEGEGSDRVPAGEVYGFLILTHLQEGSEAEARKLFSEKSSLIPNYLRTELEKELK